MQAVPEAIAIAATRVGAAHPAGDCKIKCVSYDFIAYALFKC